MAGSEVNARADASIGSGDDGKGIDRGFFSEAWKFIQERPVVAIANEIVQSGPVQDLLGTFGIVDEHDKALRDKATGHVNKYMTGEQTKELDAERGNYTRDLVLKGAMMGILPFGSVFDSVRKGPLMTEHEEEISNVIELAQKRVEQQMTGAEMEQLLSERRKYTAAQVGLIASAPFRFNADVTPEKGPMMKEYDTRVLNQIEKQRVDFDGGKSK